MRKKVITKKEHTANIIRILVLIGLLIALIAIAVIGFMKKNETPATTMPYKSFQSSLEAGQVETVKRDGEKIYYTAEGQDTEFETDYPAYENFRRDVLESGATYITASGVSAELVTGIMQVGFIGVLIILLYPMIKNMASGHRAYDEIEHVDYRFDDVIGHEEVVEDMRFIVDLLRRPKNDLGVTVPKGILLAGDPGTGKTLLAKAVAGEAGVPFFYLNASSLVEKFVGTGAARVRSLFHAARKKAPCILFIDEIDAIGVKRSAMGSGGGSMEYQQTLNQILQEIQGLKEDKRIFIIAATNRPEVLDEALTRSGRFDRTIMVNKPKNAAVRKELFRYYLDGKKTGEINLDTLAAETSGMTGADIETIVNEAGIIALQQQAEAICTAHLEEALDKKMFKGSRTKEEKTKEREIVAYHEAGHAVMTYLTGNKIARASIIGNTSGVGGAVWQGEKNTSLLTGKEILDQVKIAYAGKASEEIRYGVSTTGASNDIEKATDLIKAYVERYGFEEGLGVLNYEKLVSDQNVYRNTLISHMNVISRATYTKTKEMLTESARLVEGIAEALLIQESLSGEEAKAIIDNIGGSKEPKQKMDIQKAKAPEKKEKEIPLDVRLCQMARENQYPTVKAGSGKRRRTREYMLKEKEQWHRKHPAS